MTEWLLVPLGFVVGAYGTLIGAGGGSVLVPVLLLLYPNAKPSTVTSISLAVVFFNTLSGALAFARRGRIDFRTGISFAAATVPGAVLGAIVVQFVPRHLFSGLFGVVLLTLAVVIFTRSESPGSAPPSPKPGMVTRVIVDATGTRYEYHFHQRHGLLISIGVGFLSSLLGIGGGIIHVPAMVLFLGFPTHIATATSQFILAVMAAAGSAVHLVTGELAFGSGLRRSLLLAMGVIPGALLGVRLSQRLQGAWIIRMLAVGLVLLGVRLLIGFFIDE
jgi:uncharacterized membrane protein YfcA